MAEGHQLLDQSSRSSDINSTSKLLPAQYVEDPSEWWQDFVRVDQESFFATGRRRVRILDLFSSVGGLALGASIGASLLGLRPVLEGAVDTDLDALRVHQFNLKTKRIIHESVLDIVDLAISRERSSGRLMLQDPEMLPLGSGFRDISLLIGGPPCQGHSTLNNKTRSDDPKNKLMLAMPAVAVAMDINAVVIENVPNVVNDQGSVVDRTIELFHSHDYEVEAGVVSARDLGWPQTRKRFFIIARRDQKPVSLAECVDALKMPPKDLAWIIGDLLNEFDESDLMRSTPNLSKENQERVAWLFKNKQFDLENHMRPKCHQDGHTYPSVYGRMRWNEPAPTITGGFQTPGRGRFIHPKKRRVLTPHEAARVQGFPDWFNFSAPSGQSLSRTMLGKWIGDAVPSMMGAAAAVSALA